MEIHEHDCVCASCKDRHVINAQVFCDDLRDEIRAMAATIEAHERAEQAAGTTIEAQEKRIAVLVTAHDGCRAQLEEKSNLVDAQRTKINEILAGYQSLNGTQVKQIIENALFDEKARKHRIAEILANFYRAPITMSSVQPVLDLAVELNPHLRSTKC